MLPLHDDDPPAVGPYAPVALLGHGRRGPTYLGRAPGGRPVAVTLVRPGLAAEEGFRRRFAAEAAAARRVGGARNARVADADPHADRPWLAAEYVPGPSLAETVAERGPLPARTVRTLGAGLAEGLAALHACGLVRRDLHSGDVILTADGPRIVGFGTVRTAEDDPGTEAGEAARSALYLTPEQIRGDWEIRDATDVYALGRVLVFAATGAVPFDGNSMETMLRGLLHEAPDLTGVPADLRDVVAACLAKDPGDRPTAEEVRAACDPAAASGGLRPPDRPHEAVSRPDAAAPPPPPPTASGAPVPRARRRAATVWAAVGAAAVLAAGAAVGAALLRARARRPAPA
ncbi:serine/threonine-protein kinase [Actinomadura rifamycini]|uniref:serine/threonine-protein kinase n=1 Tax=Actinomadura rifamycini TaxID=31962 RepID=UPI000683F276|nr:serine/threonine-protein kinase [Actinomadura rifamycini]